jgi:peptidoglycan lytic transglycosylase B
MLRLTGLTLSTLLAFVCTQPALAQSAPSDPPSIDRAAFDQWVVTLRQDAVARGIKQETLDKAFTGLEPVPQVLERDRQQAEFTLDLDQYLRRRLTPDIVRTAKRQAAANHKLTARVAKSYGVEPRFQIAVWGLESNFGRFAGVRPSVPTLATLAFDGRRAGLFRGELLDALTIVDQGGIELDKLKGSWAGALGQVQFLPSSYLSWAVDFDEDGKRDIWGSLPDVLASIANYLKGHGWRNGVPYGYRVKVPESAAAQVSAVAQRGSGCRAVRDLSEPRGVDEWKAMGIVLKDGKALPSSARPASLLRIDERTWLVTENYEALLAYNCAHTYALSVVALAERLPRH